MEKSSELNREKTLNNHIQHDNEPEPGFGYPRKIFQRDPKSRNEFLLSRTGPYRGKYSGKYSQIWKRTGLGKRTGIGRKGSRKI